MLVVLGTTSITELKLLFTLEIIKSTLYALVHQMLTSSVYFLSVFVEFLMLLVLVMTSVSELNL